MEQAAVARINKLIAEHSADALRAISDISDLRVYDADGQTPLNAAIQHHNAAAFDRLMESKELINYVPELDKQLKQLIRNVLRAGGSDKTVEKTEAHLRWVAGDQIHWMRTPLLQACRYRNKTAIDKLIELGAPLDAADALGLSALELCAENDDVELVQFFVECCSRHGKRYSPTPELLEALASTPEIFDLVVRHGNIGAKARKPIFNLACALLDLETVARLLSEGHDPNASIVWDYDPLDEAVTSHLAWLLKHPSAPQLAVMFYPAAGNKNFPYVFTGDDVDKLVSEFESEFGGLDDEEFKGPTAGSERRDDRESAASGAEAEVPDCSVPTSVFVRPPLPIKRPDEFVDRRLQIIDVLLAGGFDVGRRRKASSSSALLAPASISDRRLLQRLKDLGVVSSS